MNRRFFTALALVAAVLASLAAPLRAAQERPAATAEQLAPLGLVAIQQGGRLKPLDTFARETVRHLTGKEKFQGQEPLWTILTWVADPEAALKAPVIEVRNLELKAKLGLDADGRWYSYEQLASSPALEEMRKDLMKRRQAGEKLSSQQGEQEAMIGRMHTLQDLLNGASLTVVPDPQDFHNPWSPPNAMSPELYSEAAMNSVRDAFVPLIDAVRAGDGAGVQKASEGLRTVLAGLGPYPSAEQLRREVQYNELHPFGKSWILYLVGLLLLLGAGMSQGNLLYRLGLGFTVAGFGMHAYGFYMRSVIAGRAPVTNMYESVIWATFGAVLFALILEAFHKGGRQFLMAATSTATVGLVMADNLPAVLDPSIQPLAPVLRNNFWLTIHVLTIVLGYAAFLLALGLGHMVLWQYLRSSQDKARLKQLNLYLYRALQIGVLFLAAGTILGGVWANYSWGRFWGWDPKEVWALIALLGYLALLHGRFAGWLRDFGLAAGSVLAFMGVLMAWYGVNFVLGAGLHSYGFGTGGYGYVGMYLALEIAFVSIVAWRYKKTQAA